MICMKTGYSEKQVNLKKTDFCRAGASRAESILRPISFPMILEQRTR